MRRTTNTTEAAPPTEAQPLDPTAVGRFEKLPIDSVVRSLTNPRTHFNDAYITELALSIAEKGLIQPVIVRFVGAAYEIVAGECRWRACRQAGLLLLPAIIRDYTDEQVLEVQLIENLHRSDLTPLEQAIGYRRLIQGNPDKYNVVTIAARIGMSSAWVWDRLKLNDLIPEAKAILEQERITVGHAILLARLKPEDQARAIAVENVHNGYRERDGLWRTDAGFAFDREDDGDDDGRKAGPYDGLKPCSIRELEVWIQRHVRFDVAHAAKAQPLVFDGTAAQVEAAAAQPGRGKKVIAITHEYRVADDARDPTERTYGRESWERADGENQSKTCEHSVLGVVAAGRGYGDTLQVCVARDKCRVHFGAVVRAKEKAAALRESGQGKKAAKVEQRTENQWKIQQRRDEEARKQWEAERPALLAAFADHVKGVKATPELVAQLIDGYHLTKIKVLTGPITEKNLGQVVALAIVFDSGLWDRDDLQRAVKPFKFTLPKATPVSAKPAPSAATKTRKPRGERRQAGESNVDRLKAEIATRATKTRKKR